MEARQAEPKSPKADRGHDAWEKTEDTPDEAKTRLQLQRLFKDLPGHASASFAFMLHSKMALEPKVTKTLEQHKFNLIFGEERQNRRRFKARDLSFKLRRRHNFHQLNTGYEEPEETFEAEIDEFKTPWRNKSIDEDMWKAEYYQHLHRKALFMVPESEPLASRADRFADVTAEALRKHVLEQNRPVLTHELADYENPYMMKRSALERLLQERCVRNKIDERLMPRLLDRHPDLVKMRAEAPLPPEVLEPLAAFRGDVRWSFDARDRLAQKVGGAEAALKAVEVSEGLARPHPGADVPSVVAALPENARVDRYQVPGVDHPWRNHVGFDSQVPRGTTGGTKFGQPLSSLEEQVIRSRYPTLQRVAHTLPSDPKYRAHVVRTIRVLERSKDWDFKSKIQAVNKLKEIYDSLLPSAEYTADLDEKLPLNRVPSHLKRKYAPDKQYVKTFPKRYRVRKSITIYRPSLTAPNPLTIAPWKKNFK